MVNSVMYRTFQESPTLKTLLNTFKVLHKLKKNDKQIAFSELSFQHSSGKFVTIIIYSVCKANFLESLNPHFVFVGYFTHYQICNPRPRL